jgi:8-oxo-dGTP pyrophosphatase MutT (NUDIX family)
MTTHEAIEAIPEGARRAARVLLLDAGGRLLLLRARESRTGLEFWVMPGGGLDDGEDFAQAAAREIWEETALEVQLGPWIWTRYHQYLWNDVPAAQYERYFVAKTPLDRPKLAGHALDSYITGYHWWTAEEIADSTDDFAPRSLGLHLPAIVRGEYPAIPVDCGI